MLLGIIPFALVLGSQATQKGFSFIEVHLFTGLNFAGGSEFAILELWTNPPIITFLGGVSKSMLKKSRLNFDKIEKCK